MLENVGLGGTDDGEIGGLALAVDQRDDAANGDDHAGTGNGILSVGQGGADLGDAGGIASLVLLGGIVLGVLGQVAECTGLFDVLDDLTALLALEIRELLLELLAALGSQYDLAYVHATIPS